MPFALGNQLAKGIGRSGYAIEQKQLEDMRRILGKYLRLVEKVQDEKASTDDYAKITTIGADVRKILDKLHATKTHEENPGGETINIYTATEEDKKDWQEFLKFKKDRI